MSFSLLVDHRAQLHNSRPVGRSGNCGCLRQARYKKCVWGEGGGVSRLHMKSWGRGGQAPYEKWEGGCPLLAPYEKWGGGGGSI